MARSARRAYGDGCGAGCAWVGIAFLLYFVIKYFHGTALPVLLILILSVFAVLARVNRGWWF